MDGAAADYRNAAMRTTSLPERRYLTGRVLALDAAHCKGSDDSRRSG